MDEGEWIKVVPHEPGGPLARGFWFAARAVVAWWERAVDAIRG